MDSARGAESEDNFEIDTDGFDFGEYRFREKVDLEDIQ